MRRLYGVTDERTQMAKIRYLHMKDDTQRLICRTLHEHNGMVMQKLKEDGSKKRMFNHIKRLMRKQEQKDTSIKILNSSGITVNDEQEVVKEVERFWGNLFCTNGKVTLGQNTNTNTNTNTFILEIYTYIHEIFWKYIHDMAMKRKFMMYAPGNRIYYGYCRLHFGYQIRIYIYIYITSLIETSRLMLIKIK